MEMEADAAPASQEQEQEPRCSWCGGVADRPGAVTLTFRQFPQQERGCSSGHADLLERTRTDRPVRRDVLRIAAVPHAPAA